MANRLQISPRAPRQRGTTALEVAIFTIAGLIVATIATVTMLNVSFGVAGSGERTANDGVSRTSGFLELRPGVTAVRGDVDVDVDNSIDLGGLDRQSIVKVEFTLTSPTGSSVDLTPPYAADDTGIDPDAEPTDSSTLISVSTDAWQMTETAWTVEFLGGNGDQLLEEGERAVVTIWMHPYDSVNDLYELGSDASDPWIDSSRQLLLAGVRVAIRVAVKNGSGVEFDRILPIELTSRVLLD